MQHPWAALGLRKSCLHALRDDFEVAKTGNMPQALPYVQRHRVPKISRERNEPPGRFSRQGWKCWVLGRGSAVLLATQAGADPELGLPGDAFPSLLFPAAMFWGLNRGIFWLERLQEMQQCSTLQLSPARKTASGVCNEHFSSAEDPTDAERPPQSHSSSQQLI